MDTNQRQPLIDPAAEDVVEECDESSRVFGGKAEATGDDAAVLEVEEYYGIEKLCEMAFWEWRVLSAGALLGLGLGLGRVRFRVRSKCCAMLYRHRPVPLTRSSPLCAAMFCQIGQIVLGLAPGVLSGVIVDSVIVSEHPK